VDPVAVRRLRVPALVKLARAAALLGVGLLLLWTAGSLPIGRWMVRIAGLVFLAAAVPYVFEGARLLLERRYPSPAELFPPIAPDELIATLRALEQELCVCTRCMVTIPAEFSTGSCPVCASGIEYHQVATAEDATLVIAGIG